MADEFVEMGGFASEVMPVPVEAMVPARREGPNLRKGGKKKPGKKKAK